MIKSASFSGLQFEPFKSNPITKPKTDRSYLMFKQCAHHVIKRTSEPSPKKSHLTADNTAPDG